MTKPRSIKKSRKRANMRLIWVNSLTPAPLREAASPPTRNISARARIREKHKFGASPTVNSNTSFWDIFPNFTILRSTPNQQYLFLEVPTPISPQLRVTLLLGSGISKKLTWRKRFRTKTTSNSPPLSKTLLSTIKASHFKDTTIGSID